MQQPLTSPLVCAWCPEFDPFTSPVGASHGMCQACRDRMIFDAMKRATVVVTPATVDESDVDEHDVDAREDDDREELRGSRCGGGCGYCGGCS